MADKNVVSAEALKRLEEQLTCPVCLENFSNPKILPCFHSFCLHCLEHVASEVIEDKACLLCPTCRSPYPKPDEGLATLPPSFVINNLIEVYGLMKKVLGDQKVSCDNCDKTNATSYCKQCSKFLCPECQQQHDNWKEFAGHQSLSLEEVANTAYELPQAKAGATTWNCTNHNKPLELFCEECNKVICQLCTVHRHAGHSYGVISDTYQKHHDAITQSTLQILNHRVEQLTKCMTNLINRREEINEQSEKTKEEIHQMLTRLKQILDESEKKLTEDVDLALQHKMCVIDHQIKDIGTALAQVGECRDHIEQFLKVGTPQQVLEAKSQMISRTEYVISSVEEMLLEPLEHADIELVKSMKINEISKNVGKIKYTGLLSAKVRALCGPFPMTGQQSTITISLNGSPVPVPPSLINCYLTPLDNGQPIKCSVKESKQSGQYNVVFTSFTRGHHLLHVRIHDNELPCSPVSIAVSVPPEKRDSLLHTISELKEPSGVAVTDDGMLIVSERTGSCIAFFDKDGQKKLKCFGSRGKGRGQLECPSGLALTANRTILVADRGNHRIQEFTMNGRCVSVIGCKGIGPLEFRVPCGIAVYKNTQQVYVTDQENHRVQVLNSDFTFSRMFGSYGVGYGQFNQPVDVDVDNEGFVYVADGGNNRVQKFTPDGQFVCSFGGQESEMGYLNHPVGITVNEDLIYVNCASMYIAIYRTNSEFCSKVEMNFNIIGGGLPVGGLAVDLNDYLYVCCLPDGQIKIF